MGFTCCKEDHYTVPYTNLYDSEKELGLLSSFPRLLTGCVANATAVGGADEDTTEAVTAVPFSTPLRAESGLEDLRGFMEHSDLVDIDIDDARVEDDMVVELTVYE